MSETEKPAVLLTTAANGTGPPEDTGGGTVAEKTDEKENGIKTAALEETGTHEHTDEDVKMVDAADVKVGEKNEEGSGEEEEEPMKVEGEEKETEELKNGQEAGEKSEVAKEKHKVAAEKTEDAEGKCDRAEGKSEVGNEEKGEESEEKGEETEEKGEESEEKGEEAEEKGDGVEKKSEESNEEKTEENKEEEGTRKKRRRGRKAGAKGEGKGKKESGKTKGVLRTPTASFIDRPVRERKTVERLVEIVEKGRTKAFLIEKGLGTPLKDIPNVAYKLSKKKPADIRSLHLLLFGRKGKAINFKSHIFQFSGFVWHENEDKQRAKVKEKLDKCVKDKLLDLCDVFDIPVSRAASRKEDLVANLLDFMVAPHATTDIILAEKEQSVKSRKRKRVSRSALRRCVGISVKQSRKKRTKSESTSKSEKSTIEAEDEDKDQDEDAEEEEKENVLPDEDEAIEHSESEEGEGSEHDTSEKESEYSGKGRQDTKKLSNKRGSPATAKSKKVTTPKKVPQPASTKSPKKLYSKRLKAGEAKDSNEEVFLMKKKNVVTLKKKMPPSTSDVEEKKTTGKRTGRSKAKSDRAEKSGPTEDELRKTICEILKEVDFNTATFTDILKKLASHYNMDLTARKASIKLMIQDELTKLADEAEDEDDDSEDEGDTEKVENSEPAGKEVEA